jgi:hypothetical protein
MSQHYVTTQNSIGGTLQNLVARVNDARDLCTLDINVTALSVTTQNSIGGTLQNLVARVT